MNNFTKDELEIINLDICESINRFTALKPAQSHLDLKSKVQSMIDNYCDHTAELKEIN